jgi:bacillithiol synthase
VTVTVLSTPISGTPLTRAVIDANESPYFASRPANSEGWIERATRVRSGLVTPGWLDALAPALNATGRAADNLERIRSAGFAITTGQQPGLFGGPLYTWWKALSAVSLASRLESVTGLPVVPIFWARRSHFLGRNR